MKDGWKTYRLGYLGTFFGGVTNIKPQDYGYGTPFLTYKNVFINSKVDVNELELMNVKPQDIQKRSAIYGDIFFTASSETPDEVAMSSVLLDNVPNLTYNGFCKRFRLNDFQTLTPKFARYLFRGKPFRESVCQVATGDIRFNISQESLGNISVDLPSLAEQKHIAQILGSLDDKIELNRRLNDNLEQQAQAIFKSWFVDFEPFRGDGLVGSELGMIPKGWMVRKIANIVTVKGGSTPRTNNSEYWDGEYYWATPKDLSSLQYPVLLDTERKITDLGVGQISSGILPKGTLLLSSRAPVGYLAISKVPVSVNQGFIAINGTSVSNLYMLYWLRENMEIVKGRANGSTFQEISKSNFKEIPVIIPEKQTVIRFENVVSPLFETVAKNEKENVHLANLRDTLLPKLMSSELSVEGAEQQL